MNLYLHEPRHPAQPWCMHIITRKATLKHRTTNQKANSSLPPRQDAQLRARSQCPGLMQLGSNGFLAVPPSSAHGTDKPTGTIGSLCPLPSPTHHPGMQPYLGGGGGWLGLARRNGAKGAAAEEMGAALAWRGAFLAASRQVGMAVGVTGCAPRCAPRCRQPPSLPLLSGFSCCSGASSGARLQPERAVGQQSAPRPPPPPNTPGGFYY